MPGTSAFLFLIRILVLVLSTSGLRTGRRRRQALPRLVLRVRRGAAASRRLQVPLLHGETDRENQPALSQKKYVMAQPLKAGHYHKMGSLSVFV